MDQQKNLHYTVASCSSETDANPVSNIINPSPHSNGWISLPNVSFPQELILDFGTTVCVAELKFVSHQTKIASHTNLYVAKDAPSYNRANYKIIDSFKFTDNRSNNYKTREIRVAHLPYMKFRFLKLSMTGVHENKYNKGNQIGLISVTATGYCCDETYESEEIAYHEVAKQNAADHDDFDLARKIKQQIDSIRESRAALVDIRSKKMEAIQNEDYDLAKQLKHQEQKILESSYSPDEGGYSQIYDGESRRLSEPEQLINYEYDVASEVDQIQRGRSYNQDSDTRFAQLINDQQNSKSQNIEDRPIKSSGRYNNSLTSPLSMDDYVNEVYYEDNRPIGTRTEIPEDIDESAPLEPLDERQEREAEIIIQVAGEEAVARFYSKVVSNRVAGIEQISMAIMSMKSGSTRVRAYERFCHILKYRVKENVYGVFIRAVDELKLLTDKVNPPPEIVRNCVEMHRQAIFMKLGNKNARVNSVAVMFFKWCADKQELGIPSVAPLVLSQLRQPIQWNHVLARLDIIGFLLAKYGPEDGCFEPAQIVNFTLVPVDSPRSEVRKAANHILSMLIDLGMKNLVSKILFSSRLPNARKIMEMLEQKY